MWGQGRAPRSPAGQLAVWSAYRNFFSSERASRRLCSSKELTSQRFTWDKLKRAKRIPEVCGLDSLKGHPSQRDGVGEQEGKGPPKSSQWGQRPPIAPGARHSPGSARPHPGLARLSHVACSGHWVDRRTQSPRRCFRELT